MKPAAVLSVTDRQRFKQLTLEPTGTVPSGKVMFCRGRKVLGYSAVAALGDVFQIPKGADTLCVAPADFDDVEGWIR